jgi:hypothetical protein
MTEAANQAKAKDYMGAATSLDTAAKAPGVTAVQLKAIQNTRAAMEQELVKRAVAGDKEAERQLRELASRPH